MESSAVQFGFYGRPIWNVTPSNPERSGADGCKIVNRYNAKSAEGSQHVRQIRVRPPRARPGGASPHVAQAEWGAPAQAPMVVEKTVKADRGEE
jgi:hypothetical protein